MSKLALLGGTPVIDKPFGPYNSIGKEEIDAVTKVMESGVLSKFLGAWTEDFLGGPAVRQFEEDWSKRFNCKHSISVNSATSGLFAALGAVGVGPGDEVIVPPYTMSATAMAPLIYGAIPVFADIEPETFCIDPNKILPLITPKTKAIFAVNLFGHPAKLKQLRALADEHGIKLIEDNAQGPMAQEGPTYAGTFGHIGVFSLNYHKHIHTGEGGVCVTNDDDLALRLQLIRNHGENAVEPLKLQDLTNMVGYNYRMTELGAAIGIEQLRKADYLIGAREKLASQLTKATSDLPGITPPAVRSACRHVYYTWTAKFDAGLVGCSREAFCKALSAEGFPMAPGYVRPLYLLPVFQKRIAMGSAGFPFNLSERKYDRGLCPVTERMHEREVMLFAICTYDINESDVSKLAEAMHKVYEQRDALRRWDSEQGQQKEATVGSSSSKH